MSPLLQMLILIGAIGAVIYILRRLRKLKVRMEDTIFWIFFALLLIFMAVEPKITYWTSNLLGIQSPVNLIFLIVIALLLEKLFTVSMKLSLLEEKMMVLTAEVALRCKDIETGIQNLHKEQSPEGEVQALERKIQELEQKIESLEKGGRA